MPIMVSIDLQLLLVAPQVSSYDESVLILVERSAHVWQLPNPMRDLHHGETLRYSAALRLRPQGRVPQLLERVRRPS